MSIHGVLLTGSEVLARKGGGGGGRSRGGYRGGYHGTGGGGGIMPTWVWVLLAVIVIALIIWAIARHTSSD